MKFFFILFIFTSLSAVARDFEKTPIKGNGPYPTLIILHDIWGLDNFVKREVERYAENGYYTIALDLYSGNLPTDLASAMRFKDKLSREDLLIKISKAFERINKLKKVDKLRVGVLGWGMGGSLALRAAIRIPEIRTFVMSNGDPVNEVSELKKIRAKGLALFGEKDKHNTKENIKLFKRAIEQAHLTVQAMELANADYGFFDYTRTENFNPKASEDGKHAILAFLNKHLALTELIK